MKDFGFLESLRCFGIHFSTNYYSECEQFLQRVEGGEAVATGQSGQEVGPVHRVRGCLSGPFDRHVCPHCPLVRLHLVHHRQRRSLKRHPVRLVAEAWC